LASEKKPTDSFEGVMLLLPWPCFLDDERVFLGRMVTGTAGATGGAATSAAAAAIAFNAELTLEI